MYNDYYNFSCRPFENTPDPRFLTLTSQYREVLASLVYGVDAGKGFMLLAGDVGTGKTTLIRAFLQELDKTHLVLNIINPRTTFTEIAEQLAKKLGRNCEGLSQLAILEELEDGLKQFTQKDRRVAIVIDEAHLLSERSLEDIRLLSNIEENHKKLVQIILVGQKELLNLLKLPSQKSLRQRINISRILQPLPSHEVQNYIQHRLQAADCYRNIFDKPAMNLISKRSHGIPRLINQICDNALLIGYASNVTSIGKSIIKEVVADMNPPRFNFNKLRRFITQRPLWIITGILAVLLLSQINFTAPLAEQTSTQPKTLAPPAPLQTSQNINVSEKTPQKSHNRKKLSKEQKTNTNKTKIVTVTSGQSITSILTDYYKCSTETLMDLVHSRNPNLKDISHLFLGQKLTLPVLTRESLFMINSDGSSTIHYASFFNKKIALRVNQKFITQGWDSDVVPIQHGNTHYYRIILGPFNSQSIARIKLNNIDFKNLPFLQQALNQSDNQEESRQ